MPNITSVVDFFPTVAESSVGMTLSGTIAPGAATVGVSNLSNYANGEYVVFTIDAATPTLKQVFTGQVSGSNILNVVWTYGTNQAHTTGATIIDYVSATTMDMVTAGILKQHTQAGAHIGLSNTGGATFTGGITTDSLTISGQNTANGWNPLGQTVNYATNAGNREFTATVPANVTSTLWPGMKLGVTRATVPPTQCMSFAVASSQYAQNTTSTGLTFTSAFTAEAWVYLNSYQSDATVISRYNSTGWLLRIASGLPEIDYMGTGTNTNFQAYNVLPLHQWVHIAGVISSVSGKTGAIYINGQSVTTQSVVSTATTLVQAGNIAVGALGASGAQYFDGYISEARVWSVAQTATQIQSNMAINCVGTETNLVALYQGGGNFNDATTNANNLTAVGGAIATQAANPYNPIEYGVINTLSYSSPNTTITLDMGTGSTLPNATLNSAIYSITEVPYGISAGLEQNRTLAFYEIATNYAVTTTTPTQIPGLSAVVTVPAGRRVKIKAYLPAVSIATGGAGPFLTLWDGAPNTGVELQNTQLYEATTGVGNFMESCTEIMPTSGSHTFSAGIHSSANAVTVSGSSVQRPHLMIELIS